MRLRRDIEWSHERDGPAERDLDVAPPCELEHGERVPGDLVGLDVAAAAGDGDDLGLGRGHRVQEGEAVVDPGVAVDEDRDGLGHRV